LGSGDLKSTRLQPTPGNEEYATSINDLQGQFQASNSLGRCDTGLPVSRNRVSAQVTIALN